MSLRPKDASDATTSANLEQNSELKEKEANIGKDNSSTSSSSSSIKNYSQEIANTLKGK